MPGINLTGHERHKLRKEFLAKRTGLVSKTEYREQIKEVIKLKEKPVEKKSFESTLPNKTKHKKNKTKKKAK